MKFRAGIFALIITLTAFLAVFPSQEVYGQDKSYTVKKGETLYSIARTMGVKAEDLMKYNGITDPTKVQTGLRLKIPGSNSNTAAAVSGQGGEIYRVTRGDTLYSIARKYSITVETLREVNSLPASYLLREGDLLRLPSGVNVSSGVAAGNTTPVTTSSAVLPAKTQEPVPSSSLKWPVSAKEISYMTGKLSGVMITGTRTEAVSSLTWGTVLSAGPYRGFGRVVIIQVDGGYLYVYGGCESLSVKEGDRVGPGTELGRLGVDAVSNKPQLFFMVYRNNSPIDPAKAPRA